MSRRLKEILASEGLLRNRKASVRAESTLIVGSSGLYVVIEIFSDDLPFIELERIKESGEKLVYYLLDAVPASGVTQGRLRFAEPMLESRVLKLVWEIPAKWTVDENTLLEKLEDDVSDAFDKFSSRL